MEIIELIIPIGYNIQYDKLVIAFWHVLVPPNHCLCLNRFATCFCLLNICRYSKRTCKYTFEYTHTYIERDFYIYIYISIELCIVKIVNTCSDSQLRSCWCSLANAFWHEVGEFVQCLAELGFQPSWITFSRDWISQLWGRIAICSLGRWRRF